MPIRLEFRFGISIIHRGSEPAQVIGNRTEALPQTIDLPETLNVLTVSLLIGGRQSLTLLFGNAFDLIQHVGLRFMLLSNVTRRNAAVHHLVQVIGI